MIDIFIKNAAYIVTINDSREIITDGAVAVDKGIITAVGKTAELLKQYPQALKVIDAAQSLIMPGLVNAHTHTVQQLARSLGNGVYYPTYIKERIQKYEESLTPEDAYYAALLACIEAVKSGTTCLLDTVTVHPEQVEQAIKDSGIRAVLHQAAAKPVLEEKNDTNTLEQITERVNRCLSKNHDLIRPGLAVTGIAAHNQYMAKLKELAQHHGLCFSADLGVNQTMVNRHKELFAGVLPLERWNGLDILDSQTILNHANYVEEEELDILIKSRANVVHCPTAGFGLGLGATYGQHRKLLKKGVAVAIGSSSVASGGTQDMFKVAYSLGAHRDLVEDATLFPPEKMLEMVCQNGAGCSAWPSEIGSLVPGHKADFIIVKTDAFSWTPLHNPLSNLFLSGSSSEVHTVVVAGRLIMEERRIQTVNEEEIIRESEARGLAVANRSGLGTIGQTYWPII